MAYGKIKGNLMGVEVRETQSTGNEYLALPFWTDCEHENDRGQDSHVIRISFTKDALEYAQRDVKTLLDAAGVDSSKAPTTAKAAKKMLDRKELAWLEFNISTHNDEYKGEARVQYSVGFADIAAKEDTSDRFKQLVKEKLEAAEAARKAKEGTTAPEKSETVVDDDDLPF